MSHDHVRNERSGHGNAGQISLEFLRSLTQISCWPISVTRAVD